MLTPTTTFYLNGQEWKKVAAMVKTRTVVQTRTHAQKYFQKLQKCGVGEDGDTDTLIDGVGRRVHIKRTPVPSSTKYDPQLAAKRARMVGMRSAAGTDEYYEDEESDEYSGGHNPVVVGNTGKFDAAPGPVQGGMRKDGVPRYDATKFEGQGLLGDFKNMTPVALTSVPLTPSAAAQAAGISIMIPTTTNTPRLSEPSREWQRDLDYDKERDRGAAPKPSPAASGKRKEAELEVARMLLAQANEGVEVRTVCLYYALYVAVPRITCVIKFW